MSAARVLFGLAVLTCLFVDATAVCCMRKPEFGCCGSGSGTCNVFCCNCGGCDTQCEYSECATFLWLRCSKIVGICVAKCGNKDIGECKSCMGEQHESCKQCVVAADKIKSAEGNRKADLEKDRVAFHNSFAGEGKDPDLSTFTQYDKVARTLPGSGVDTSKPGTMKIADAFKIIDPDFDGDIGRGEFDNDKLTIKLGDLIIDGDNVQPPAKEQPDDKTKQDADKAKQEEDDKTKQEADKAKQEADKAKQDDADKKKADKATKQSTGFKGRKFKSPPADDFFNGDPFFQDD